VIASDHLLQFSAFPAKSSLNLLCEIRRHVIYDIISWLGARYASSAGHCVIALRHGVEQLSLFLSLAGSDWLFHDDL